MKYFIVTSTIKDGEYEYVQQTPASERSENEALSRVRVETAEWTRNTGRDFLVNGAKECTKDEYLILRKYIY